MKTRLLIGIGVIAFTFLMVGYINSFHNNASLLLEPRKELLTMELPQSNIGDIEFHTHPVKPNEKQCYMGSAPSEKYFRYECTWVEKPRGGSLTAMEIFSKIHNPLMLEIIFLKNNGGSYQYNLSNTNAGIIDSLEFDVRRSDMSTTYMRLYHGTTEHRELLASGVKETVDYLREQLDKNSFPQEDSKTVLIMQENRFFEIPYKISNGTVFGLESDTRNRSLTASMILFDKGNLIITIPRELLDSRYGCNSTIENAVIEPFFVLGNAEEIDHNEIETTNKTRTLSIPVSKNITSIEILATCFP